MSEDTGELIEEVRRARVRLNAYGRRLKAERDQAQAAISEMAEQVEQDDYKASRVALWARLWKRAAKHKREQHRQIQALWLNAVQRCMEAEKKLVRLRRIETKAREYRLTRKRLRVTENVDTWKGLSDQEIEAGRSLDALLSASGSQPSSDVHPYCMMCGTKAMDLVTFPDGEKRWHCPECQSTESARLAATPETEEGSK